MKSRPSVALYPVLLGAYLLIHAGIVGDAAYGVNQALQDPSTISDSVLPEMRERYPMVVALFGLLLTLGAASAAAGVGFARRLKWAMGLWLTTSVAVFAAVAFAVVFYRVTWTHYVPQLAIIALSWWDIVSARRSGRKA